jgi:8-oxo-dGTP pyrophosphatase MutT (NUDIX family)
VAATVVLLRDAAAGPEVLLQRRAQGLGFMAGAHVFPGGRLDETDAAPELSARCDLSAREAARRLDLEEQPQLALGLHVAALRELFEEAGVLLARRRSGEPIRAEAEPFPELRRAVHQRSLAFSQLLQREDLILETSRLAYLARWITPELESRRFDARFFLAAGSGPLTSTHDAAEAVESLWLRPEDAVEQGRSGLIVLPPPTAKTLELLRGLSSVPAALAWAEARRPVSVCPEALFDNGRIVILLPGDPQSSRPEPAYPGPTRYLLDGAHWRPG